MKSRFILAILGFGVVTGAAAQPAEFLNQYKGMANTGRLELEFCMVGEHICVWRHAQAWGQVCDPHMARSMGEGKSGSVDGTTLPGSHYAAWRCTTDNPDDAPYHGKFGTAEEWPDMPELPKWTSDPEVIARLGSGSNSLVFWGSSGGQSGSYLIPESCHVFNERGHPIKSWWAREDRSCHSEDAP